MLVVLLWSPNDSVLIFQKVPRTKCRPDPDWCCQCIRPPWWMQVFRSECSLISYSTYLCIHPVNHREFLFRLVHPNRRTLEAWNYIITSYSCRKKFLFSHFKTKLMEFRLRINSSLAERQGHHMLGLFLLSCDRSDVVWLTSSSYFNTGAPRVQLTDGPCPLVWARNPMWHDNEISC